MTRWFHAVLLAILTCLLLVADVTQATVGGPSSLELLGWDAVERKIFVAIHFDDPDAWDHPALGYWQLDAADPGELVLDHAFDEAGLAEGGPDRTLDRIDALRQRLDPLSAVDLVGLELRERQLSIDRCHGLTDPALHAPCREVLVQLHWQGQVQELHLTTWGMSDLVGAWEVPETGHRVVLYSHLGHTWEIGYQQEVAVLFEPAATQWPADPPSAVPSSPQEQVEHSRSPDIRHY